MSLSVVRAQPDAVQYDPPPGFLHPAPSLGTLVLFFLRLSLYLSGLLSLLSTLAEPGLIARDASALLSPPPPFARLSHTRCMSCLFLCTFTAWVPSREPVDQ